MNADGDPGRDRTAGKCPASRPSEPIDWECEGTATGQQLLVEREEKSSKASAGNGGGTLEGVLQRGAWCLPLVESAVRATRQVPYVGQ